MIDRQEVRQEQIKKNTKNNYFHLRVKREWKDKVRLVSEMNNVSLSKFIRDSVDKNIQSLSL